MQTLEAQIFYNILMYQVAKLDLYKINAKTLLAELAGKYHIKIKQVTPSDLKTALMNFNANNNGYLTTISKLYYSL